MRVEPGRGGELAGTGREHGRFVSVPPAGGAAHESVVGRDHPRVSEHFFGVEVLVACNLIR